MVRKSEVSTEKENNYGDVHKRYDSINTAFPNMDNDHKLKLAQAGFHVKGKCGSFFDFFLYIYIFIYSDQVVSCFACLQVNETYHLNPWLTHILIDKYQCAFLREHYTPRSLSYIRAMLIFDRKGFDYLCDNQLSIIDIMPTVLDFIQRIDISWVEEWLNMFYSIKAEYTRGK